MGSFLENVLSSFWKHQRKLRTLRKSRFWPLFTQHFTSTLSHCLCDVPVLCYFDKVVKYRAAHSPQRLNRVVTPES